MTVLALTDPTPVLGRMQRRRWMALSVPVILLGYLAYVALAFDVPGLVQKARMDNAAILVSDFWSHKVHITRDNRTGTVVSAG